MSSSHASQVNVIRWNRKQRIWLKMHLSKFIMVIISWQNLKKNCNEELVIATKKCSGLGLSKMIYPVIGFTNIFLEAYH